MTNTNYEITKLQSNVNLPIDLLLLADETIEAIEKYITKSEVYLITQKSQLQPVAVFVLYEISNKEIEIKNIAVAESLQGKGIGSFLLDEIKGIALARKHKRIIVGTPENSRKLVHFYEKNGFAKYAVRKDFFIRNYSTPIIENGLMLRNMVMLKLDLGEHFFGKFIL